MYGICSLLTKQLLLMLAIAAPIPESKSPRVFHAARSEEARRQAMTECCPLVVHFLPNNQGGMEQYEAYYVQGGVSQSLLAKVVILVLPMELNRDLASQLGVNQASGYRAISPYHLSPLDKQSKPTCVKGFR